jgi:hypothetical protein
LNQPGMKRGMELNRLTKSFVKSVVLFLTCIEET